MILRFSFFIKCLALKGAIQILLLLLLLLLLLVEMNRFFKWNFFFRTYDIFLMG